MNSFERLKIEFEGIRGTIAEYTHDSNIINFFNQLKKGIDTCDFEIIHYTLECICEWYNSNLEVIENNQFVYNYEEHCRNYKMLEDILDNISETECIPETQKAEEISVSNGPLIFISHCSKDKKYGDALRNFITGLGVKDNQIIYTSHPLHKIPLDQNIYDYLRDNIRTDIFMIVLWSNDYLESPACMNELGAAWVVQNDYTNIYVPDFSFGNPKYHQCAVDTHKMGAVLNADDHCRASMIELKDKLSYLFNLKVDEQRTIFLLEQFIKEIKPQEEN